MVEIVSALEFSKVLMSAFVMWYAYFFLRQSEKYVERRPWVFLFFASVLLFGVELIATLQLFQGGGYTEQVFSDLKAFFEFSFLGFFLFSFVYQHDLLRRRHVLLITSAAKNRDADALAKRFASPAEQRLFRSILDERADARIDRELDSLIREPAPIPKTTPLPKEQEPAAAPPAEPAPDAETAPETTQEPPPAPAIKKPKRASSRPAQKRAPQKNDGLSPPGTPPSSETAKRFARTGKGMSKIAQKRAKKPSSPAAVASANARRPLFVPGPGVKPVPTIAVGPASTFVSAGASVATPKPEPAPRATSPPERPSASPEQSPLAAPVSRAPEALVRRADFVLKTTERLVQENAARLDPNKLELLRAEMDGLRAALANGDPAAVEAAIRRLLGK